MGILNPGSGTTFRYIDFNDENDSIRKVMRILFSLIWQWLMAVKGQRAIPLLDWNRSQTFLLIARANWLALLTSSAR